MVLVVKFRSGNSFMIWKVGQRRKKMSARGVTAKTLLHYETILNLKIKQKFFKIQIQIFCACPHESKSVDRDYSCGCVFLLLLGGSSDPCCRRWEEEKERQKKKDLGRVLAGLGGVLSNRVRDKRNEMCAKGKEACYLIIYYNMSAY